jgi:hypothetical protein
MQEIEDLSVSGPRWLPARKKCEWFVTAAVSTLRTTMLEEC